MATPPRPTRYDQPIRVLACEALEPAVSQWLRDGGDIDIAVEDVVADLVKATSGDLDGYRIARSLEHQSWEPDAGLVEVLEGYYSHASSEEAKAVKMWVRLYAVEPSQKEGYTVTFKSGFDTKTGVITEIRRESAEYLIQTDPNSTSRSVVGYEKLIVSN
jgi:hypothetical protein